MSLYRERVFPALAAALWAVFLWQDLMGGADSTGVKFLGVCLCMLTAWTGCRGRDGLMVAAAMTLTVCADVFLLLLDRGHADRMAGVSVFLLVQLLYAYRLYVLRGRTACRWGLCLRLVSLLALLGPALGLWDALYAVTAVYFPALAVNCLEGFALRARPPVSRFGWGLLLFVGCDLCVGCWNLGLAGGFPRVGMWLFYLPAQVLIVLSQDGKGGPLS